MAGNVIATTVGAVEIETYGSGVPVTVIHGSPGGIDATRAMSRFLPQSQFKVICVSRPGYLETPLDPTDPSIDHEADLLAAALDAVDVQRTGLLAWSGGGPAAYRFAVRHPSRVTSIVAIAAVSFCWIAPPVKAAQWFMFGTTIGQHLVKYLSKKAPKQVVGGALEGEGSVRGEELRVLTDQVMADPQQSELVLEIAQTVNTNGKRQAGWQNDVAIFASIPSLELHLISCPVLLIHGDADTDAIIEHSHFARSQLPNSMLTVMKNGTHLAFYAHTEAPQAQKQAKTWLNSNL